MPFFDHDDAAIFYTDEGSGPPVLLLHGWSCDSHDWSFQIPVLLDHGFRVIALDHRGHGRSSAPEGSYSLFTIAADAAALLEHLGTEPVVLIGHSMGSIVASVLTVEYPQAVKALVVVQPIYQQLVPQMPPMAAKMRNNLDQAPQMAAEFFDQVMYTPRTPAWVRTWNRRRVLGNNANAIVGCLEATFALDGKVIGPSEPAMSFMRRRGRVPRLAVCGIPAAPAFEEKLGVEESKDEVHFIDEGTFLHLVEHERVNGILIQWLLKRDMLPAGTIQHRM